MGVQFICLGAPVTTKPCSFCIDWRERGWIKDGERCDQFCDGTEDVHAEPRVDFASSNAVDLLRLLGFHESANEPGHAGECDGGTMRQRIMRARSTDRTSQHRDPQHIPGGHAGVQTVREGNVVRMQRMGAEVHVSANTDEQILRRLGELERLAVWAQEHNLQITWG